MITYTVLKSYEDLSVIMMLQESNLLQNLKDAKRRHQRFLTVTYIQNDLKKMDGNEYNIIAKDKNKKVKYVLAMTKNSSSYIPILIPMFECFDKIIHKGKLITDCNYIVVGQVCIDKEYRGKGMLDDSYKAYINNFKNKYDFDITEIATTNIRSRASP